MSSFLDYLSGTDYVSESSEKDSKSDSTVLLKKILNEQVSIRELLEEIADTLADMAEGNSNKSDSSKQQNKQQTVIEDDGDEDSPKVQRLQTEPLNYGFNSGSSNDSIKESVDFNGFGDHVGEILAGVPEKNKN